MKSAIGLDDVRRPEVFDVIGASPLGQRNRTHRLPRTGEAAGGPASEDAARVEWVEPASREDVERLTVREQGWVVDGVVDHTGLVVADVARHLELAALRGVAARAVGHNREPPVTDAAWRGEEHYRGKQDPHLTP